MNPRQSARSSHLSQDKKVDRWEREGRGGGIELSEWKDDPCAKTVDEYASRVGRGAAWRPIKIIKSSDVRHYCATPVVAVRRSMPALHCRQCRPGPAQQRSHTRAPRIALRVRHFGVINIRTAGVLWHVHNVNRIATRACMSAYVASSKIPFSLSLSLPSLPLICPFSYPSLSLSLSLSFLSLSDTHLFLFS